jgi:dihydropteroate synthase
MAEEGAHWIDVGGESSRPGAEPVSLDEESRRVIPVVEALAREGLTVSVDTTKAAVAERALDAGARIINDISAFSMDDEMAPTCARYGAHCVLMHMRGTPRTMQAHTAYEDIVAEVRAYLEARMAFAVSRGVRKDRIIVDPGIGFGKSAEGNMELLRGIRAFLSLGRPVLIGASRKSFIGAVTGDPDADRLGGSVAVAVLAVLNGAGILRVHDVRETRQAVLLAEAFMQKGPQPGRACASP